MFEVGKEIQLYSMHSHGSLVKRSLSITVLDGWITVSFLHQILDYTEMSIPVMQNSMSLLHVYAQCIIHHYKSKLSRIDWPNFLKKFINAFCGTTVLKGVYV